MKTTSNKKLQSVVTVSTILASCLSGMSAPALAYQASATQSVQHATMSSSVLFFDPSTVANSDVSYKVYDLNDSTQLSALEASVQSFLEAHKAEKKNKDQGVARDKKVVGVGLQAPYNSLDITDKGLKQGSEKILQLIGQIRDNQNVEQSKFQIAQISRAIQQNYTNAYNPKFELLMAPVYLVRYLTTPTVDAEKTVLDQTPDFISNEIQTDSKLTLANMYDYLNFKSQAKNCQYDSAKRGYGVHPGFKIDCDGVKFKVKFGNEIYSGPFNSRIYRAVGYLAPQINYVEDLSLPYDRKMFTEINMREKMDFSIAVAGLSLYKFTNKKMVDPFAYVKSVTLKNKTVLSGAEAREKLVGSAGVVPSLNKAFPPTYVDLKDTDFNKAFEQEIESVNLVPVTITLKDDDTLGTQIGLWSPSDLNYGSLKEVRALIVVSAWLGNYDVRKQNLMLSLVGDGDNKQLKMVFADAGSGLGKSTYSLSKISSSTVNDMAWIVSSTIKRERKDTNSLQELDGEVVKLSGLMNTEYSSVFGKIKISDAQWMLSKMCLISPVQITQALVASGMSSAEVVLAREKLLSRRNQMLVDLKMPQAIVDSCKSVVDTQISYDPNQSGPVSVYSEAEGKTVSAPIRGQKVINGQVVSM